MEWAVIEVLEGATWIACSFTCTVHIFCLAIYNMLIHFRAYMLFIHILFVHVRTYMLSIHKLIVHVLLIHITGNDAEKRRHGRCCRVGSSREV